eukprot:349682-Chlamydomonas_euryale.AAC.21
MPCCQACIPADEGGQQQFACSMDASWLCMHWVTTGLRGATPAGAAGGCCSARVGSHKSGTNWVCLLFSKLE